MRFALVQCLQTQLPPMQLDRELIDVTGHFGALRVVFLELSPDFFREGNRGCARPFLFRHQRLLPAFLAGQIHARSGPVRNQRRFAVLAVKENIRIGIDFSNGTLCCFHTNYRAGAMPEVDRDLCQRPWKGRSTKLSSASLAHRLAAIPADLRRVVSLSVT